MPVGRKGAPPVHMVRLTEQREITPYPWVHPDERTGEAPPSRTDATLKSITPEQKPQAFSRCG